jgi:hypothetical protein
VLNFAELPPAYVSLHESHFAHEHPYLKRFEPGAGSDRVHFYSAAASEAWAHMTRAGESTSFDAITKYVALNGLRPVASTGRSGANGSQQNTLVALVDEAQDLSAAQVDYFVRLAAALGLLVIFVGDGVQTIYKFRGTDSIHYANLVNFAIVPFLFDDPADYDRLDPEDVLEIDGLADAIAGDGKATVRNVSKGTTFAVHAPLSERQKAIDAWEIGDAWRPGVRKAGGAAHLGDRAGDGDRAARHWPLVVRLHHQQ